MTLKCETTMETTASTLQAPESNQALLVDDSSAKTIEFLRARLLSERAASKAARQQAQEIAEKVKDLNTRLEMEVKNRKEAEAAMGKVFTILKAKGLAVDAPASTDIKDQGVSSLDDIKEMNKDPQDFASHLMDPTFDKEVSPTPSESKDQSTVKGIIEKRKHSTSDPHAGDSENGIVSKVDQTVATGCNNREASPHAVRDIDLVQADIRDNFLSQNAAEHQRRRVQLAVTDKPMVYSDNISSPNGTPDFKDSHTSQAFDQGSSITLKLKAMLHQIEEEVATLPKDQPLKFKLQSWVEHVAGVLDTEKAPGSNGGSEMHSLDSSSNADTNHLLKEATAFKTRSFLHSEDPILPTKKESAVAPIQMHEIPEGVDTNEEMGKTLSIVTKDMLQQTNMLPPLTNCNEQFPSRMYPPTGKDPVLPAKTFHNRRSSYDALHFLQQPPKMPMHPHMMQHGISQTSVTHAPLFANGYSANSHFMGAEAPYYIEAQSPRSSDVFSVGDSALKVGYGHEQWYETQSQGRGLGIERQVGYREDALKRRSEMWSQAGLGSREMLSSPYIVDVSNEVHLKQDKYVNPRNIQLERGHSYSHRTYMDQVRNAAEFNMTRHLKGLPLSDTTLSLTDDRNGRLGDILMVLDAARQHVHDEERSLYAEEQLFAPPTPTVEDARLNRGYQYGDDLQQVPYEHLNRTWRSRARSQTPIIQFPPSPASEHGGYSPFERHGRHRRSSSVSANFMMSGWDSYLQPRGEVQLGNGITLYTD